MTIALAFWLIYILYVILSIFLARPDSRGGWAVFALQAVLFFLLGWGIFGAIVEGG